MLYAMILVTCYSIVVLGGCSPIHMRCQLACFGIFCVIIATTSGYGLSFLFGLLVSEMHNVLPFMLLGIGVDNMFVIVSCVDQTPTNLSVNERFKVGLVHSGPSITITSVTDAIAFFLASWTALAPLESFCLFAGLCLITLYIAMLSLFACWFIWDLRRQQSRKGDCNGLCFCREDSKLFCGGKFLTKAQKEFSDIDIDKEQSAQENVASDQAHEMASEGDGPIISPTVEGISRKESLQSIQSEGTQKIS